MNSSTNQQNSATRGGQGSVATPANAGGSGIFGGTGVGATNARSSTENRRRSSQEGGPIFGNLHSVKHGSGHEGATGAGRKSSFAEQRPAPGFLGKMWQDFTGGNNK